MVIYVHPDLHPFNYIEALGSKPFPICSIKCDDNLRINRAGGTLNSLTASHEMKVIGNRILIQTYCFFAQFLQNSLEGNHRTDRISIGTRVTQQHE